MLSNTEKHWHIMGTQINYYFFGFYNQSKVHIYTMWSL